jgi:hypothetical protein
MPNDIADGVSGNAIVGPIREIDVLWINAGLSCDGDTIATTAATQPSIEDLVLGALRRDLDGAGIGNLVQAAISDFQRCSHGPCDDGTTRNCSGALPS